MPGEPRSEPREPAVAWRRKSVPGPRGRQPKAACPCLRPSFGRPGCLGSRQFDHLGGLRMPELDDVPAPRAVAVRPVLVTTAQPAIVGKRLAPAARAEQGSLGRPDHAMAEGDRLAPDDPMQRDHGEDGANRASQHSAPIQPVRAPSRNSRPVPAPTAGSALLSRADPEALQCTLTSPRFRSLASDRSDRRYLLIIG
jgi:hypothetical protein